MVIYFLAKEQWMKRPGYTSMSMQENLNYSAELHLFCIMISLYSFWILIDLSYSV